MSLNNPQSALGKILQQIIQQPAWKYYRDYCQIKYSWHELVNSQATENSKPLHIEKDTLYVATSSAVWAQELSLQSFAISKKIQTHLQIKITKIKFSPARWHSLKTRIPPVTNNEIKLQAVNLQQIIEAKKSRSTQSESTQALIRQLLEKTKAKSSTLTCPQCNCLTTQAELTRWQVCRHCIAQKWNDEYRPPKRDQAAKEITQSKLNFKS